MTRVGGGKLMAALDSVGRVIGVDRGGEEVEGDDGGFETPESVFESSKTPNDIALVDL